MFCETNHSHVFVHVKRLGWIVVMSLKFLQIGAEDIALTIVLYSGHLMPYWLPMWNCGTVVGKIDFPVLHIYLNRQKAEKNSSRWQVPNETKSTNDTRMSIFTVTINVSRVATNTNKPSYHSMDQLLKLCRMLLIGNNWLPHVQSNRGYVDPFLIE